jgi:uncharacterized protein
MDVPCTHIGHGIRVMLDWNYHQLAHASDGELQQFLASYPRALRLYQRLLADPPTLAQWDLTAYMAVEKFGFNDHGQMHAQVTAANAARLLQLLVAGGVEPDVVISTAGSLEEAYVVVVAAALLHDIGNQVGREGHERYSVMLAQSVLTRLLPDLYPDPIQAQVLLGFILSAIASHDCAARPVTVEGGIVAVADAADMTQGRGQVAFDQGKADIHAMSAMAVRAVTFGPGDSAPVHIEVIMDNPAGLFQVEQLLTRKLLLSGLDRYISLRACVVRPGETDTELASPCLVLRQGRFQLEGVTPIAETAWPKDPVCGMAVAPDRTAGWIIYDDTRYPFCSMACLTRFRDEPALYVPVTQATPQVRR